MIGGSTLGSISNTVVSIPTVDIGLPQLAMHSACETCAAEDLNDMVKILCEFYASSLKIDGGDIKIIK
jgi:aspartyl aminopeptidase